MNKVMKFILVCLICISLVTGIVLLIRYLFN